MHVLQEDSSLCARLARALLPQLATAAVALQLPQERRPAGLSWMNLRTLVAVTSLLCSSGGAALERPALLRRTRVAAQLVTLPPDPASLDLTTRLLAPAARQLLWKLAPTQRVRAELAAPLVRQLLTAVPTIGSSLAEAAAEQHWTAQAHSPCAALRGLAAVLVALLRGELWVPHSQQDVRACCAGVAAALRLLPPLAEAAGQPDEELSAAASAAARNISVLANAAAAALLSAADNPAAIATCGAEGAAAAHAEALWPLHSRLARPVHAGAGATGHLVHAALKCLLAAGRRLNAVAAPATSRAPLAAM